MCAVYSGRPKMEKREGDEAGGKGPSPAEPFAFLDEGGGAVDGEENDPSQRHQPEGDVLGKLNDPGVKSGAEKIVEGLHAKAAENGQDDDTKSDNPAEEIEPRIGVVKVVPGCGGAGRGMEFSAEDVGQNGAEKDPGTKPTEAIRRARGLVEVWVQPVGGVAPDEDHERAAEDDVVHPEILGAERVGAFLEEGSVVGAHGGGLAQRGSLNKQR